MGEVGGAQGIRRYVLSAPAWRTGIVWRIETTEEELPDRIVQYIAEVSPSFPDVDTSEGLEDLEAQVVTEDWGAGGWPRNHHQRGEVIPGWDG